MTQDRVTSLFFEMFTGLPRQGPGDTASTLKALGFVPDVGPESRVLDIGCGTGLQTRVLARHSPARFLAVDNHPPFVEELKRQAALAGLSDRLDARVGDMRRLDLPDGSFDLIWAEGSICVMGFEAGLREWRRLLAPGGYVAVTEVCWIKPGAPSECQAFWAREYPAIREVSAIVRAIEECGYEAVEYFALPPSAWWDDYYAPLQQNVRAFRNRHRDEPDAQELADQVQHEIDIWQAYGEFYSYVFFVMRATREVEMAGRSVTG